MSAAREALRPWLEVLYDLRRDRSSGYEKPYKPVLLLSLLDLIDTGHFAGNLFPLTDALIARFKSILGIVRRPEDKGGIAYPFYHLCGDGFWQLLSLRNKASIYHEGQAGKSPSVKALRAQTAGGTLDTGLWGILQNRIDRERVRQALIQRYFPGHQSALNADLARFHGQTPFSRTPDRELHVAGTEAEVEADADAARQAAFRKIILDQYDCTCAACRLRVRIQDLVLVEAAHLIPFAESHNDHPSNGIALCKNHHWAMDRFLIAPGPDNRWHISTTLDPYSPALKPLVELDQRPLVRPKEKRFRPAEKALAWRLEHLAS